MVVVTCKLNRKDVVLGRFRAPMDSMRGLGSKHWSGQRHGIILLLSHGFTGTLVEDCGRLLRSGNVNCIGISRALQLALVGGRCITTQVVPTEREDWGVMAAENVIICGFSIDPDKKSMGSRRRGNYRNRQ